MKKPVTIYDIAKKANTSTATVSRVLSKSDYPVREELRKKIERIAEEMNYIPNVIGRQLKTSESKTIGVIVPSISNPFYSSVVLGIEEIARSRGYHVFLCNSHRSPEVEKKYLKTLFEKQVKGLILSSISRNSDLLKQLIDNGLNVVALDQSIENIKASQIHFDYVKGGFLATELLIQSGHEKIGFISSPLSRPSRKGVYRGFQKALEEYNLPFKEEWIQIAIKEEESTERNYEFMNGMRLTKRLLEQSQLPTALFTCNDMTAFGVMKALADEGVNVPEDISIVGFDNIELSEMVTPSLTTVEQPDYEMGRMASNILLDRLSGKNTENIDIVLQPKLIERHSTTKRKAIKE